MAFRFFQYISPLFKHVNLILYLNCRDRWATCMSKTPLWNCFYLVRFDLGGTFGVTQRGLLCYGLGTGSFWQWRGVGVGGCKRKSNTQRQDFLFFLFPYKRPSSTSNPQMHLSAIYMLPFTKLFISTTNTHHKITPYKSDQHVNPIMAFTP